jgi:uncharacterized OsmC-like protein
MEEKRLTVDLERVKDYEFRVRFGDGFADLVLDEPPPLGADHGPNASKVLSAAIGNCLAASLLFCLRKSRLEPRSLHATVETTIRRNEKGRFRIGGTRVAIKLDLDAEARERAGRCLELFEDFCTVTESVRSGIPVDVEVRDPSGTTLFRRTAPTPS